MALGKIAGDKSPPQTKNRGQPLTLSIGSGLLLLAVGDVLVDGDRLEGVGVAPTIEVENSLIGDRQIDRAVEVLSSA